MNQDGTISGTISGGASPTAAQCTVESGSDSAGIFSSTIYPYALYYNKKALSQLIVSTNLNNGLYACGLDSASQEFDCGEPLISLTLTGQNVVLNYQQTEFYMPYFGSTTGLVKCTESGSGWSCTDHSAGLNQYILLNA